MDPVAYGLRNVITIQTRQSVNLLEEAQHEDDELIIDHYYDHPEEWIFHSVPGSSFKERYPKVIKQLHTGGIIGEDPMKLWAKNHITCKLDLKNPTFINFYQDMDNSHIRDKRLNKR